MELFTLRRSFVPADLLARLRREDGRVGNRAPQGTSSGPDERWGEQAECYASAAGRSAPRKNNTDAVTEADRRTEGGGELR